MMLPYDLRASEELTYQEKINCLEEMKIKQYQNLWVAAKAVLKALLILSFALRLPYVRENIFGLAEVEKG